MKTINTSINNANRGILLGIALLGATTLVGFATPASAQPRRDGDVKAARKDVKEARKDVRRANTPEARRDAREDLRGEKKDLREEKRENRPGNAYGSPSNGSFRPGYQVRPNYQGQNRPGYQNQNRPVYQNGGSNFGRSYTGTVTRVRSGQSFDLSIGGNNFNVYTNGGLPRGLSNGDTVQVSGVQQGANDIRNASVSLIRNR